MRKLIIAAFATGALLVLSLNAKADGSKPTIVLVHGAWEQADIWSATKKILQSDGYDVVAVSLPGRPESPLAPNKVTLTLYRDTIIAAIAGQSQPVVLIGHSFAGFSISEVAEAEPAKIKTLVYVAAYLPKNGQTLFALAAADKDSKIGPHLQVLKSKGLVVVDYASRAGIFCNDCDEALRVELPGMIVPEPIIPLATPVHLSAVNFGSVDKVYIHTARDQVVSPFLQAAMVAATPVREQMTLNTGHTPFLTNPLGLAKDIEIAAQ